MKLVDHQLETLYANTGNHNIVLFVACPFQGILISKLKLHARTYSKKYSLMFYSENKVNSLKQGFFDSCWCIIFWQ